MEILRSFKDKMLRGLVDLPLLPDGTLKKSVLADIIIEREAEGITIKMVLADGTGLRVSPALEYWYGLLYGPAGYALLVGVLPLYIPLRPVGPYKNSFTCVRACAHSVPAHI